ncbi:D-sedoheptulose-7-phosphate isomerase [Parahaliea aestuarii]|uniref:SIS domain-containing protein n=1 Tax=Parahaliea aestuarii TaxID=1852021 RepID=A0A5C9A2C9_9GAMM|nr:SIS domain-containing protein [Parahaliea aestuarii]TXS94918.1 SIS domain-containing protein [Parahaliea aestuarii]
MDHYELLAANCQGTIEALAMAVDPAAPALATGAELMVAAMLNERKILACGSGPDAALAQLFAINLLGHFQQERPALPALALASDGGVVGAIASADGSDEIYARQVLALGQSGDVLLCIASAGLNGQLQRALESARERNMAIALLSNGVDERIPALLSAGDAAIALDRIAPSRALERHAVLLQNLCEFIDHALFGGFTGH